jgi:hypothetical protein
MYHIYKGFSLLELYILEAGDFSVGSYMLMTVKQWLQQLL